MIIATTHPQDHYMEIESNVSKVIIHIYIWLLIINYWLLICVNISATHSFSFFSILFYSYTIPFFSYFNIIIYRLFCNRQWWISWRSLHHGQWLVCLSVNIVSLLVSQSVSKSLSQSVYQSVINDICMFSFDCSWVKCVNSVKYVLLR